MRSRTRSLHARNSDFHNGCSAPLPQPSSPSADLSALPAPTWTDNTRVSPSFKMNALLVYCALVVDVFVAAYADITYGSTSQVDVMATIFQICSFFLTVMCLYNMMSETQLVKRAMFFKLADEFAPAVFLTFLYFVFILATRFYRLGLVYQNYPHLQIWSRRFHRTVHLHQNRPGDVLLHGGVVDAEAVGVARAVQEFAE